MYGMIPPHKTNLISNDADNHIDDDGSLTKFNLLPGTYTFYVTISNVDFCEEAALRVSKSSRSILGSVIVDPALNGKKIIYRTPTSIRPTDAEYYRKVRVILFPVIVGGVTTDFTVTVLLQNSPGGLFYKAINAIGINTVPPATLKIGFGGSTWG